MSTYFNKRKDSDKMNFTNSKSLYERAMQTIPGGVNSPVRACKSVGADPLFIERADGCLIYDADGNCTHYRDSEGCEYWYEYDEKGNPTYGRNSEGCEYWYEYDEKGNRTHFRNSEGYEWGTPRKEKGVERPRLYVHDTNGGIKGSFRAATPHEILLVVDSLGTRIESQPGRKQLVKSSKKTAKRYKKSGVKVKAGMGVGGLLASGAAVTVAGVGVGLATMGPILGGASAGAGAGIAVGGLLLLGPALAVGGVVRGVNNSKVNNQIELRQTVLPLEIPAGDAFALDVFLDISHLNLRIMLKNQ